MQVQRMYNDFHVISYSLEFMQHRSALFKQTVIILYANDS